MKLNTSKGANVNYLAEIVHVDKFSTHPNNSIGDVVNVDRNLVDLSKIWHDASEKPYRHKPILIQCGYPLHTYEATALTEDVIWGDFVVLNAIYRWAYVSDLLPKGGEK